MNVHKATDAYESWLAKQITILPADLALKHRQMSASAFFFLRATFYRWMQIFPEVCGTFAKAPKVLGVGDLHVQNFGTWRDVEARLIWGINDFDETYMLPYAVDLIRLSVSAHMAVRDAHLSIGAKDDCDAILDGYCAGLASGGKPFVLAEDHTWLRHMVSGELRDPIPFWKKLDSLPRIRGKVPGTAEEAIERLMPAKNLKYEVAHRVAGLGSLGRERYVGLADYAGSRIAREAKALAPSACVWVEGGKSRKIYYQQILDECVRACDPFVRLKGRWIVRRLAPDCSRVDLATIPKERDESRLLRAMGWETANVHLGTAGAAKSIVRDMDKRDKRWLHEAAEAMLAATLKDWGVWRKG